MFKIINMRLLLILTSLTCALAAIPAPEWAKQTPFPPDPSPPPYRPDDLFHLVIPPRLPQAAIRRLGHSRPLLYLPDESLGLGRPPRLPQALIGKFNTTKINCKGSAMCALSFSEGRRISIHLLDHAYNSIDEKFIYESG